MQQYSENRLISVGICDDEEKLLPYIQKKVKVLFEQEGYIPGFAIYSSADAFIEDLNRMERLDVVFLDISMPETDGITLASRIRKKWGEVYLIFVSAREEKVFDAFCIQPFYFVRKRLFEEDLSQAVHQLCMAVNEKNRPDTIVLNVQNEQFQFAPRDILFVEAADKYLTIVGKEQETLLRYRISDMEALLQPYGFIRIHKSYLVNFRCIFLIKDKCVVLDNKKELPLSRHRMKQVRQEFRERIQ